MDEYDNCFGDIAQTPYGNLIGEIPAAGYVTTDHWRKVALEIAREYGADSLSDFMPAVVNEIPELGLVGDFEQSDNVRMPHMSGIARSESLIEVLCWPHDYCLVKRELEKLAIKLGMRIIQPITNNLSNMNELLNGILPNTPFAEHLDYTNPPNGWVHSGKGETRLWQYYWQIQPNLLRRILSGNFDEYRTFLMVFGATWHYAETDDYETRIAFSVYSLKDGDDFHWDEIYKHRIASEKIAAGMLEYLQSHPASEESIAVRRSKYGEMFIPSVDLGEQQPEPEA